MQPGASRYTACVISATIIIIIIIIIIIPMRINYFLSKLP